MNLNQNWLTFIRFFFNRKTHIDVSFASIARSLVGCLSALFPSDGIQPDRIVNKSSVGNVKYKNENWYSKYTRTKYKIECLFEMIYTMVGRVCSVTTLYNNDFAYTLDLDEIGSSIFQNRVHLMNTLNSVYNVIIDHLPLLCFVNNSVYFVCYCSE